MKHFSFSCQGASHIASEKPCQDSSASYSEDGVSIIVVADGHGGERYFRSDIGSKICTEVTINAIKQFITLNDTSIFHGSPFTQVSSIIGENSLGKLNDVDNALRRLFASIILAWNQEIEKYTLENPPTDIEVEKVAPEYIKSLSQGIALEKIYGCTLMAYVQTPEFWFAFHLGDGKCVSFHQGESSLWKEPIPWDEKCFLNKTTSICDSEALDEFRYCYQGNGHYPAAIFLGSDGMDDSFGPIENLVDFYMQVIKLLAKDEDAAIKSIIETLPVLSKRGSQDDMSVAFIFHRNAIDNMLPAIITSQIESIEKQINDIGNKMNDLQAKLESIAGATDNKSEIERNYASSDIERCKASLDRLNNKLNIRKQELAELNSSIGSSEV
jgi:serine/threonine protein phosphatase PrpC